MTDTEKAGTMDDPTEHLHSDHDDDGVSTTDPTDQGGAEVRTPGVGTTDTSDEPDTFPREYVEDLRKENAGYRDKAKDRDELAHQLHDALVAATGRLQDPTDLPFDDDHLRDPAKLVAAIDELLTTKPHLASRKPHGNIGQGMSAGTDSFSLAGVLRQGA